MLTYTRYIHRVIGFLQKVLGDATIFLALHLIFMFSVRIFITFHIFLANFMMFFIFRNIPSSRDIPFISKNYFFPPMFFCVEKKVNFLIELFFLKIWPNFSARNVIFYRGFIHLEYYFYAFMTCQIAY